MLPLAVTLSTLAVATALLARLGAQLVGCRLRLEGMALAVVLALAAVAPRARGPELIVPTGPLGQIPGALVGPPEPFDALNDAVFQFLPWEAEVRRALRAGRLPYWSDRIDGGSSIWVNPQAQIASLPTWLARLFPLQHFLLAALVAKLVLAASGGWVLAAKLGLRRPARALAAVSTGGFGSVLAWSLFPHSSAAALAPWLVAGAVEVTRRPGFRPFLGCALTTCLVATAGHPETALFAGVAAALLTWQIRRLRDGWIGVRRAAAGALTGLALAAPLLAPFLFALPGSARFQEVGQHGYVLGSESWRGLDPHGSRFLGALFHPQPFGIPYRTTLDGPYSWPDLTSGYAGLVALSGSGLLLFSRRRRRFLPLLLFAAGSYLLAARIAGADRWLSVLPVVRSVFLPRALPVAAGLLAIVGAAGWESLLRSGRSRAWYLLPGLALPGFAFGISSAVIGTWTLIASAVAGGRIGRRRAAGIALLLAAVLDFAFFARPLLPHGTPSRFYPTTRFLAEWVTAARADGNWRVAALEREIYPSSLAVYGFEDIRPHNPMAPEAYLRLLSACCGFRPTTEEYFGSVTNLDSAFVDYLGVRWAIVRVPASPPHGWRARLRADSYGASLWSNPDALPRWFVPAAVEVVVAAEIPRRVAQLDDPYTVLLPAAPVTPGATTPLPPLSSDARIELLSERDGEIRLRISSPRPTLIATRLLSPRGWRVRVAERPLQKLDVHGVFLGFVAPSGENEVELTYRPPGLFLGFVAAALALVGLLTFALFTRRGHPRFGGCC